MDITAYSKNISLIDGIWRPHTEKKRISYPQDGNSVCFQIEDNSYWFCHRNQCIKSCLSIFQNENDILFDIGGGNGFVAKQLETAGYNVVLLEPGEEGAKNARQRGVQNIICATLQTGGFHDNCLDSIGVFDVIEHIEDDNMFVSNLHKYLKKDGKLYVTVPALNKLWSINDEIAGHFRRYSTKSLRKLLEINGFEINYISYIFSPLTLPLFTLRSIPSKLGFLTKNNVRQKTLKHHKAPKFAQHKILNRMFQFELSKIKSQRPIYWGTSCIAVATKK